MTALGESLEKAGLEKFFKIINHPTEPKQPLLAEGAPPSDKITVRKLPL